MSSLRVWAPRAARVRLDDGTDFEQESDGWWRGPELANGALSFGATRINDAAQVGGAVASVLNHVFDLTIPLPGIPFKIRVTALRAERSGVIVQLRGTDLSYSKS